MFENISYKKKTIFLILFIVVLSMTAYKRSFKITMEAATLLKESKEKLAKVSNAQQHINNLKAEVKFLDKLIGKESGNPKIVQQEILSKLGAITHEHQLEKLDEVHIVSDEYFKIYTNRLEITGNFENLLKTTYDFEQTFDYSRVVGVSFYTYREPRSRKVKLFEQIIFQNYEKVR